jgi:hypothetical protein
LFDCYQTGIWGIRRRALSWRPALARQPPLSCFLSQAWVLSVLLREVALVKVPAPS